MTPCSVKMLLTVECSSRRLLHDVLCSPFQTWLTCLVTTWRGGASVDTSTCFHSPFLLLRTLHCSNITARRIQVLPHKGMPLTAGHTFTTQHNSPQTSFKSLRLRDLLIWLPLITFPYLSLHFLSFPYLPLPFITFPYHFFKKLLTNKLTNLLTNGHYDSYGCSRSLKWRPFTPHQCQPEA